MKAGEVLNTVVHNLAMFVNFLDTTQSVALSACILLVILFAIRFGSYERFQGAVSQVIHHILCLRYPSLHVDTGSPIPSAIYHWPNGQGDTLKFHQGREAGEIWRRKYGKIYRIWSGFNPEVVLTTANQVKAVFKNSDRHKKAVNNDSGYLFGELLGQCVGLISGEDWKRVRSVTEHAFTREASNTYLTRVEEHVTRQLGQYEESASFKAGSIDPAKDLKMIPFWIIAEIIYGKLSAEMETALTEIIPVREQLLATAFAGGIARFSWSRYLPTSINRSLRLFKKQWENFNDLAVLTASTRRAARAPITSYYDAIRRGTCSKSQILQTIDEMLFANLDVTLGGLTWNLIFLAANGRAVKALRNEIFHACLNSGSKNPTALQTYLLRSNTYLQSVIQESSRLRPLAAFSVPQSAPSAHVIDGYLISRGTNFIIDSYSINQQNPYWGLDTASFRPERFMEGKATEMRYNFWRFGFGARQCLGKHVADLIIRTLLVELVQRYEFLLPDQIGDWKRNAEVWIDHPDMKLSCRRRQDSSRGEQQQFVKPIWKPGEEISGFQIGNSQIAQRITPAARNLLEKYVGLASDDIVEHVAAIQKQAYARCPPGCMPFIGHIRFLALPLLTHPSYAEILSVLTPSSSGPKVLVDLGCCFGQDMRQLMLDGADLSESIGVDIEDSFIKMGHQLFRDSESEVHFETADIFDQNHALWSSLAGKVDVVHASNFFHTFEWNRQLACATQIGRLLNGSGRNTTPLVVGCTVGSTNPREVAITSKEKTSFCHDEASFGELWDQVGLDIGIKFRVEARLQLLEPAMRLGPLSEPTMRLLLFKVALVHG